MRERRHRGVRAGIAVLWLLSGAAGGLWARGFEQVHPYGKKGESSIRFYTVFDQLPRHGYAPVVIEIQNGFSEAITWNITFISRAGSGTFRSNTEIRVQGKGGRQSEEILVPVPTDFNAHGYASTELDVTATASGLDTAHFKAYSNATASWPAIAVPTEIATPLEGTLTSEGERISGTSYGFDFGTAYEPIHLPADWRGYTGLDALMMTAESWAGGGLRPESQTAALEWVHLGGSLDLFDVQGNRDLQDLGFAVEDGASEVGLGSGKVRVFTGPLSPASVAEMYHRMKDTRRSAVLGEHFQRGGWHLQTALGLRSFNAWIIVMVLTVFAVLVGPVNLFFFARSGKRHRLFLTTPLISIGASLLLVLVILAQDRFGGVGNRLALVELDPEGHRAFVTQEQFSRTGVLFSADFDAPDPLIVSHVLLPQSQWTRVRAGWGEGSLAFALDRGKPDRMRGDWFFSRSEQGHFLQSVRPTRARLERLEAEDAANEVVLFSNLGFTLDALFYVDGEGEVWASEGGGAPGRPLRLRRAADAEYETWWKGLRSLGFGDSTETLSGMMSRLALRPGHFYASASGKGFEIDTLSGVRWNLSQQVLYGPVPLLSKAP